MKNEGCCSKTGDLCKTLADGGTARQAVELIDRCIGLRGCDHVTKAYLTERDATLHLIYHAPCFDVNANAFKCLEAGTDTLFLLAQRPLDSYATSPIRFRLSVETTPGDALIIDGGHHKNGNMNVDLRPGVLAPASNVFQKAEWRETVNVRRQPQPKSETGAIAVSARVTIDGSKNHKQLPELLVGIPSLAATIKGSSTQETKMALDMLTLVITQSMNLLLKEGWESLKALSADSDIIQLKIGGAPVSEGQDVKERITEAAEDMQAAFSRSKAEELDGLNRQLDDLYITKGKLIANIEDSDTSRDKAKTEAAVARTTRNIENVRKEIWKLLQQSGQFSLEPRPK